MFVDTCNVYVDAPLLGFQFNVGANPTSIEPSAGVDNVGMSGSVPVTAVENDHTFDQLEVPKLFVEFTRQ